MTFDSETEEILIDEELLMQAIMLANPGQERCKIRLVTHDELLKKRAMRRSMISRFELGYGEYV